MNSVGADGDPRSRAWETAQSSETSTGRSVSWSMGRGTPHGCPVSKKEPNTWSVEHRGWRAAARASCSFSVPALCSGAAALREKASGRRKEHAQNVLGEDLPLREENEEHKMQRPRRGPDIARSGHRYEMVPPLRETACTLLGKAKRNATLRPIKPAPWCREREGGTCPHTPATNVPSSTARHSRKGTNPRAHYARNGWTNMRGP